MADVHFFGQIRRRIVDNDGFRLVGFRYAETRVVQGRLNVLGEELRTQAQVDKARAGYFRTFNHSVVRQYLGHFLRQLARILFGFFRRTHHAVDLEIAVFGILGRLQNNGAVGNACGGKGCLGFTFDGLV